MISTRSWRWPLAVVLVLLATAAVVRMLMASAAEPALDDELAVLEEDESSFDPVDLPEPPSGSVEALGPSSITRSPKELLPPRLGGGKGPKREFAVRVIDRDGNGVAGATVGVWTKDAKHPYSKRLAAAREAFFARYYPAAPPDSDSLAWSWLVWADPTWADPVDLLKTDADGRCSVMLPDGNLTIAAAHETAGTSGRWIGEAWEALAGPDGSEPYDLVLRLAAQGRVSGRVVDAGGHPVGGALVFVSNLGGSIHNRAPRQPRPAVCDDDGRFALEIDVPAFNYIRALGQAQWSTRQMLTVQPDSGVDVTLRIGSAASISGRVLDPKGEPAAGADVHASGPERTQEETKAGDDGSFTLALPQTGRWVVGAAKDDWLPQDAVTLDVGESAPTATTTLRLVESASIRGRVRWKSGEPAADLAITAHQDFRSRLDANKVFGLMMPFLRCTSDADGQFELTGLHPAGRYEVRAGRTWSMSDEPDAEEAVPGTFLELEVDDNGEDASSLNGRVVDDESGEPVQAFSVCVSFSRDGDVRFLFGRDFQPFRSPDGSFQIDDISWGKPYVRILAAGYAERIVGPVVLATQSSPLEIRLGRPAQLDVRVVDEEGGGVAGAVVLLKLRQAEEEYDGSVARETTTDAAGHAVWIGLQPEAYSVQAIADDQRSAISTVTLGSGGQHVHELTLDPDAKSGRLVVQTIDATGERVSDVGVRLMTWATGEGEVMSRHLRTDAAGEASFAGLPAGRYSVFAEISGSVASDMATITAGASTTVELRPRDP